MPRRETPGSVREAMHASPFHIFLEDQESSAYTYRTQFTSESSP
jgi:hypothetical protein